MYSPRSHSTVPDPLSAGLMIQSVWFFKSRIVFLSADERLWRVFCGITLYNFLRRLVSCNAWSSCNDDIRHVHGWGRGLLILINTSFVLSVRFLVLSLSQSWVAILFTIMSTSSVHMWWFHVFGVGINLRPLSSSVSDSKGAGAVSFQSCDPESPSSL